MIRIVPNIPQIKAQWCRRSSDIPDVLMVPMSDGSVVQYYPQVDQPAFRESLKIIKNMKCSAEGYTKK